VEREAYGDAIAKKLEDATLRSAAMSSLSNLGAAVTERYMDDVIAKCLKDKDSITRQTAATALGAIGPAVLSSPASAAKIVSLLQSEEIGVRCSAALSLGYMGEAAAEKHAAAVAELLSDPQEDSSERHLQVGGGTPRLPPASRRPKCAALIALGMMSAGSFAKECAKALSDDSYEVRLCAIECLSGMGDAGRACSSEVSGCLEDENFYVRMKACECIGSLRAEDAMLTLPDRFDDPSPSVRAAALLALMESTEVLESFSGEIFKCLQDPVPAVKAVTITALSWIGPSAQGYASVVATFLGDQDAGVRSAACDALSRMGARGGAYAEEIEALCHDENPAVANAAAKALEDIGENGAWEEEAGMLADGE
jgi:HEAT repeat protein